jgi:phage terminase large subunit-like protein
MADESQQANSTNSEDPTKPTDLENQEIEQLKGQAQLAQNIYMNRSVSAESAMNLAKDFMDLVNKRFSQTRFAKRLSQNVEIPQDESDKHSSDSESA